MRTSSRPSHSSNLRIGGSFAEGSDLGQTGGGSSRPTLVVDRVPLAGPLPPLVKVRARSVRLGTLAILTI